MGRFWNDQDLNLLAELSGDMPWCKVPAMFNKAATVKRTECAMRRKAAQLGILRECTGQYVSPWQVALAIGCSHQRVLRWCESGKLPFVRYGNTGGHGRWIKRDDLADFARRNPELFGGMRESDLVQLLSNETLAEELAAMKLPRLKQATRVVCVESGFTWRTIAEAAKAAYVTKQRMRYVVRHGGVINGRHYRAVD
jgi:hypothetical protein